MLSPKEIKVIALIGQDVSYSNYFFHRVKDLKWFYPFKQRGFFLPEKIPQSENGEFLFWNILDYLERVSEQVVQNPQYGKELIDIIYDIVQFSQNKKQIVNYYIWRYCVKILNNLPTEVIKKNLSIEKFRLWCSVWTKFSSAKAIPITDIGGTLLSKFLGDDSTLLYAETIIDAITDIKLSGKFHPLTKNDEVVLACDSYWIRDAFKKIMS